MPFRSKILQITTPGVTYDRKGKSPQGSYTYDQSYGYRFVPGVSITEDSFPNAQTGAQEVKRFLHLDLSSSALGTPLNPFNRNDCRGFYVDRARLTACLRRPGEATPHPDWSIRQEAPVTENGDGSITSSISYNANASIGAFGPTPTVSGGGGATFSSAHSHSVKDFSFAQRSDGRTLLHDLQMSQTSDGSPYTNWNDLVPTIWDPFEGAWLRVPPLIATSNLPICSQAVWMNDTAAGLEDNLELHISVQPNYVMVEATNKGILTAEGLELSQVHEMDFDIDFGQLN